MSTGLIALPDDVAGLAKVAAASLDDVAAQATKAGVKAASIVIDDAAVTPRYVVGFAASRELPIVGRIALGSIKNKLLYLLPAALAFSAFASWTITPLLMLGGVYLCYEGVEKIQEALWPHLGSPDAAVVGAKDSGAPGLEEQKVRGAIKTDFILSAEIMAITLATVPDASFWVQAVVLAVVGISITALVYGGVALIVKADDVGLALARHDAPVSWLAGLSRRRAQGAPPSRADRVLRPLTQDVGSGLVVGMPVFLRALSVVSTAAMVWVGGGIILHGIEEYGVVGPGALVHAVAVAAGEALPDIAATAEWAVTAAASGTFGVAVGAALVPLVDRVGAPALRLLRRVGGKAARSPA